MDLFTKCMEPVNITNGASMLVLSFISMIEESDKYKDVDEKYWKKVIQVNALDYFLYKLNKALECIGS
jgi:hypothetical protein